MLDKNTFMQLHWTPRGTGARLRSSCTLGCSVILFISFFFKFRAWVAETGDEGTRPVSVSDDPVPQNHLLLSFRPNCLFPQEQDRERTRNRSHHLPLCTSASSHEVPNVRMTQSWSHHRTLPGEVRPSVVREPKAYTNSRKLLAVTSTRLVRTLPYTQVDKNK